VVGEETYVAQNDAWHAYVELALGLTDTSRKKAMKIVQQVAGKGGATAEQLQDLVNQGMANREAMTRMIRVELDRALGRVGLATMDEVDELSRRVRELETELRVAQGAPPANPVEPVTAPVSTPPTAAKKTVAKKTVAKKTVAKKTVAKKTAASAASAASGPAKAAAKSSPAKVPGRTTATKTTTSTAAATKTAPAKKTAASRVPAKKVVGPGTPTARKASARKAATKVQPARKTAAKTSSTGSGVSGAATGDADLAGGAA
jgi:polyhydroxyalkanoate synthesis regulator phasin